MLVGLGMRTWADGRVLLLGSPSLLRDERVRISKKAMEWVDTLRKQAETPLLLAVDGKLVGLISLRDEVRPEAAEVLKRLRDNGIRRIVMLTGDHPETAAAVAGELGIDEWRAEVLPDDKLQVVRALQDEGYVVGMVGDGVNDAPPWRPPISVSPWAWPEPMWPSKPPTWRWPTITSNACSTCETSAGARWRSSARTTACRSRSTLPDCSSAPAAHCLRCSPQSCITRPRSR